MQTDNKPSPSIASSRCFSVSDPCHNIRSLVQEINDLLKRKKSKTAIIEAALEEKLETLRAIKKESEIKGVS